jgi:hypothetical protein
MMLAIVVGLWLLAPNFLPSTSASHDLSIPVSPSHDSPEHTTLNDAPPRQVLLRTIPTNIAGLGSVVAQLRSSAAIATMLGASFSTFSLVSAHSTQYRAASLLHIDLLETPVDAGAKVCSFSESWDYGRNLELVESWCDNNESLDAALELRRSYADCGVILDDRPWDVRYDMSKCTWKWVKHVFSNLGPKKPARGIGLHIRWGDMSLGLPSGDPLTPLRSTPIDKAAELLRKIRECGVRDELSVYMEWHNATMLEELGEPYRIVDTGDSLDDLIDLASNRLMILDVSSWTVLAHQITDGGISIVPDTDGFSINWHDNGLNHVLRWNELLSIPCSEFLALYNL